MRTMRMRMRMRYDKINSQKNGDEVTSAFTITITKKSTSEVPLLSSEHIRAFHGPLSLFSVPLSLLDPNRPSS